MKKTKLLLLFMVCVHVALGEDGYKMWLRYSPIANSTLLQQYRRQITGIIMYGNSPSLRAAREELNTALPAMLQSPVPEINDLRNGAIIAGTVSSLPPALKSVAIKETQTLDSTGYLLLSTTISGKQITLITAKDDIGVLYGAFTFLRKIQTRQNLQQLKECSSPKIKLRLLNHWDNLNRYVERGYAGISIWNWHTLPAYIDQRYIDYARFNASIGINGTVLNNVNANATVLTHEWLLKVAAIANTLRPYGIKVFLSARFSAPIEIGHLSTADPLNDSVRTWWQQKAKEIYQLIPDFGGFLVKANSEGQPGPQSYHRTHADGANLLADALAPYGGIVMWRAFVYDPKATDRFKQAYEEFTPLDGSFHANVMVQVKNGPIDFQPREPFSPLLGAMPKTPLLPEFQLTQEYLGQGTHLVYMSPLFREVLQADTYSNGPHSTVATITDGSLLHHTLTAIAGVSNIGNERNWTGHPFGQANWYAFGRLAWDHSLSSESIAKEWIQQTFGSNPATDTILAMMMASREILVNYMTPLGLHHIMGNGHHYGPAPWSNHAPRADWDPVYYHRADSNGIGFDRTANGSGALLQYQPPVQQLYADSNKCEDKYLLWFHHVSWQHRMHSGRTLWQELCFNYNEGVLGVRHMQQQWKSIEQYINREQFHQVSQLLALQEQEAVWWRDACLSYFSSISRLAIPVSMEQPAHSLQYYQQLHFPYAPGN